MARFKLTIEYEGTRYSGWQIQKNARTIQGEIQEAIHAVFQTHEFEFMGSGRTDAGVHALRQVAHLDIATVLAPEIIRTRLNDSLPADINILEVEKTLPEFHARHDALSRSYLYQISRRRTAFGKRYVWWVKDRLDIAAMRTAAEQLHGLRDFRGFTADDPDEKSTSVKLEPLQIEEAGDLILIRVVGSHFLWKMVRQIVGVLVEVGRGSLHASDIPKFMNGDLTDAARFTAPPSGLFLERVSYPGTTEANHLQPTLVVEKIRRSPVAPPQRHVAPPQRHVAPKSHEHRTHPKTFHKRRKR